MRKRRCNSCGKVSEVENVDNLPRCGCGRPLSMGTWIEDPPRDGIAEDSQSSTGGDGEAAGSPASLKSGAVCDCGAGGGPSRNNPALCFQCGKPLKNDEKVVEADDDEGRSPARAPEPEASSEREAISCLLVLEDGRSVTVGDGILVSGQDGGSWDGGPRVVALDSPTVSRRHAWLRSVRDGVEVVDLASTNGTWLGGRRIEPLRPATCAVDGSVTVSFGRSARAVLTQVRRG